MAVCSDDLRLKSISTSQTQMAKHYQNLFEEYEMFI